MSSWGTTRILAVCILVTAGALTPGATVAGDGQPSKLLFEETFDSGHLKPLWSKHLFPAVHSSACVKTPTRAGAYAHRSILRKSDEPRGHGGKPRAEMCLARQWSNILDQEGGEISGGDGDERWYGLSIFIPGDWEPDLLSSEIILQWLHIWGSKLSPNLDLRIKGDALNIRCLWDEGMVGPKGVHVPGQRVIEHDAPRINEGQAHLASIPMEKLRGRWTDWVFHCKWSSREDGLLTIWLDDERIVQRHGPNCRRTDIKFEFKMGLYKPGKWLTDSVTERIIYHDEIRIGGPDATYEDVAPGGKTRPPLAPADRPAAAP